MAAPLKEEVELRLEDGGVRAVLGVREGKQISETNLNLDAFRQYLLEDEGLSEFQEDVVASLIEEYRSTKQSFHNVVVADHGRMPVHGRNGQLDWLIDGDEPAEQDEESGRTEQAEPTEDFVDFFAMHSFRTVQAGQEFARLVPPADGQDGVTVKGEAVAARKGRPTAYLPGENVRFNEATGLFTSDIEGRIEISGKKIQVSRVLNLEGDVDFSTGNIKFAGMVNIPGSVRDNFRVDADEGVCVRRIVEAGTIHSGGTISLMGGVNARDKGEIVAGGDVIAKFVVGANIRARGEVQVTKEIISSHVHGSSVIVSRGCIAGGKVTAVDRIEAAAAGNEHCIRTVLHVNYDYFAEEEHKKADERLAKLHTAVTTIVDHLRPLVIRRDKLDKVSAHKLDRMLEHVATLEQEQKQLQERRNELLKREKRFDGEIILAKGVFPGVILKIGRYEKVVNKRYEGRRRIRFDAEKYDIIIDRA